MPVYEITLTVHVRGETTMAAQEKLNAVVDSLTILDENKTVGIIITESDDENA